MAVELAASESVKTRRKRQLRPARVLTTVVTPRHFTSARCADHTHIVPYWRSRSGKVAGRRPRLGSVFWGQRFRQEEDRHSPRHYELVARRSSGEIGLTNPGQGEAVKLRMCSRAGHSVSHGTRRRSGRGGAFVAAIRVCCMMMECCDCSF